MITTDPHKFLERFVEESIKPIKRREPVVLVSWWPPPPTDDAPAPSDPPHEDPSAVTPPCA